MLALLLQEHHLTRTKAAEISTRMFAKNHGLLYIQADRPVNEGKGGTAIVIPFDMIESKQGESPSEAIERVAASRYASPDGRVVSITTLVNGSEITLMSVYAPVNPAERPDFFTNLGPKITKSHLIGMDGNCVFNPALDVSRPGGLTKPEDTKGTPELRKALDDNDLTDVAREALGNAPYFTNVKVLQGGLNTTRKRIDHLHVPHMDAISWHFVQNPPDLLAYQDYGHSMLEIEMRIIKEERGKDLPFISESIYDDPVFNDAIANAIATIITSSNPTAGEWGETWEAIKEKVKDLSLEQTKVERAQPTTERQHDRKRAKYCTRQSKGVAYGWWGLERTDR